MYSLILMAAMPAGDVPAGLFHRSGCSGTVQAASAGCHGTRAARPPRHLFVQTASASCLGHASGTFLAVPAVAPQPMPPKLEAKKPVVEVKVTVPATPVVASGCPNGTCPANSTVYRRAPGETILRRLVGFPRMP